MTVGKWIQIYNYVTTTTYCKVLMCFWLYIGALIHSYNVIVAHASGAPPTWLMDKRLVPNLGGGGGGEGRQIKASPDPLNSVVATILYTIQGVSYI